MQGMVLHLNKKVETFEKGMVELRLKIGSHTALQEKLGLYHHEKVLTGIEHRKEATRENKKTLVKLTALEANIDTMEKQLWHLRVNKVERVRL